MKIKDLISGKFGALTRALGENPSGRTKILENDASKEPRKHHMDALNATVNTDGCRYGKSADSGEPAARKCSDEKDPDHLSKAR